MAVAATGLVAGLASPATVVAAETGVAVRLGLVPETGAAVTVVARPLAATPRALDAERVAARADAIPSHVARAVGAVAVPAVDADDATAAVDDGVAEARLND